MPITIDTVDSSDTINQGRIKWNANDADIADQGNSLEEQQADHVGEGHPELYYTKAEVDAAIGAGTVEAGDIIGTGDHKAVDNSSIGLNLSNELEVKDNGISLPKIPDGLLTLVKSSLKFYFAKASQTGTNNPSVTVLDNTLGFTPTWVRASTGYYLSSAHDALYEGKTFCLISQSFCGLGAASIFTDDSGPGARKIGIYSQDTSHALADSVLSSTWILIVILP
jgi:hypothetical protein